MKKYLNADYLDIVMTGFSKVATWVLAATFLIYLVLSGVSYFVEGF